MTKYVILKCILITQNVTLISMFGYMHTRICIHVYFIYVYTYTYLCVFMHFVIQPVTQLNFIGYLLFSYIV